MSLGHKTIIGLNVDAMIYREFFYTECRGIGMSQGHGTHGFKRD